MTWWLFVSGFFLVSCLNSFRLFFLIMLCLTVTNQPWVESIAIIKTLKRQKTFPNLLGENVSLQLLTQEKKYNFFGLLDNDKETKTQIIAHLFFNHCTYIV